MSKRKSFESGRRSADRSMLTLHNCCHGTGMCMYKRSISCRIGFYECADKLRVEWRAMVNFLWQLTPFVIACAVKSVHLDVTIITSTWPHRACVETAKHNECISDLSLQETLRTYRLSSLESPLKTSAGSEVSLLLFNRLSGMTKMHKPFSLCNY